MSQDWLRLARPAFIAPRAQPNGDRQRSADTNVAIAPNPSSSLEKDRVIGRSGRKSKSAREKRSATAPDAPGKEYGNLLICRSPPDLPEGSRGFRAIGSGAVLPIALPLRLSTGQNEREHHHTRARRVAKEREAVHLAWLAARPVIHVHLVRVSPHHAELDDDNNVASLKHVRDQVAEQLGVDDGDRRRLRFTYGQDRGPWGVRIFLNFERGAP
jgi:hypothetical protein